MKAPKSYLTTAFSAPMRTQKARIANLFAQNRRRGGAALAALCAVVLLCGILISCEPSEPKATVPLDTESSFTADGTVYSLGCELSPLLGKEDRLTHPHDPNASRNGVDVWDAEQTWYDGATLLCSAHSRKDGDGVYRLSSLTARTDRIATARGVKVGDSMAAVQAIYPEAVLSDGYLEYAFPGGEINFGFENGLLAEITLRGHDPLYENDDDAFLVGETAHALGEGARLILDGTPESHVISGDDGRVVTRYWDSDPTDSRYDCYVRYIIDRRDGSLRLQDVRWSSDALSTARGVKVGDSVKTVLSLYPEAVISYGTAECTIGDVLYRFGFSDGDLPPEEDPDAVLTSVSLYTDRYPSYISPQLPQGSIGLTKAFGSDIFPYYNTVPERIPPINVTTAMLDSAPDDTSPNDTADLARVVAGPDGWALYRYGELELLRHGDRWQWFDLPWNKSIANAPTLFTGDFDGDGEDDLAITCPGFHLFFLDPGAEDWLLRSPCEWPIEVGASLGADGDTLILTSDYASLSVSCNTLFGSLPSPDDLTVQLSRSVIARQNGDRISITIPVYLHDRVTDRSPEIAHFIADVVYIPAADFYTYVNFQLSPPEH